MRTYALALDLKDDPALIREYEAYHKNVWPEVLTSIKESGIQFMQIYRTGNRLFMQMTVNDRFSFEKKAAADNANPKVIEWEELMWKYQQGLPGAAPGQKWILMEEIFSLEV
ncbi:L-rhamnose mutarotase [Arachidicoccus terrestris]|uniref:L-rhamnose mutarotase n=1 Tax=Arachidicoccus terrestris TaxID=2875539 RepID=UPI001CC7DD3D|nr:L-rhamnose mutarotase [Arachidicoccus terrestris]UAY54510.1 L-rhamnose mutarotase [Arachidicoccus terrestris]